VWPGGVQRPFMAERNLAASESLLVSSGLRISVTEAAGLGLPVDSIPNWVILASRISLGTSNRNLPVSPFGLTTNMKVETAQNPWTSLGSFGSSLGTASLLVEVREISTGAPEVSWTVRTRL